MYEQMLQLVCDNCATAKVAPSCSTEEALFRAFDAGWVLCGRYLHCPDCFLKGSTESLSKPVWFKTKAKPLTSA